MSNHDTDILNLMLFTYLFKTKIKVDEKFNAKCIQNNGH